MDVLRVGDIVVRKSYDADIVFKVVAIGKTSVLLRGVQCRIMADAPVDDLMKVSQVRPSERNISLRGLPGCESAQAVKAQREPAQAG
ncbi:MAG TPA: hypothetical protein GXX51_06430 [Firmicutes bacterium]|nr:hypothetical protein [Bacillota bacterium]